MKDLKAEELLEKYLNGLCTPEEKALVESGFLHILSNSKEEFSANEVESASANMRSVIDRRTRNRVSDRHIWLRMAAAAMVLLFLSVGVYFLNTKHHNLQTAQSQVGDLKPGGNKATLTLGNGEQIALSNAKNGKIADQGSTAVNKPADGTIAYHSYGQTTANNQNERNTITTPLGGQYKVVLADGTRVWLNAASSITYPTSFTTNERKVELSGEAYFEVAHNRAKPFRVISKGQTVEVLGTHFNINAYQDEPTIKTTLLEGSVKVSMNKKSAMLTPGQQSVITTGFLTSSVNRNSLIQIRQANTEEAVAWKNGYFQFENETIQSVMRKLCRWYNIQPQYAGNLPTFGFSGTISRNKNMKEVLKMLELTQAVHFAMEGGKITVKP